MIGFLKGTKLILSPIEHTDITKISGLFEKWFNDEFVTYYMVTGQKPKNRQQIEKIITKDINAENNTLFVIIDKKSKKSIGYTGLWNIDQIARKAEFRILIGEKSFWGKGYGTETLKLINKYGFERLNLNRIYLGYTADNIGAGKAYTKAGYVKEGILQDDIYRNNRYYDSIKMALLRKIYDK